jgi:hypothetical protein
VARSKGLRDKIGYLPLFYFEARMVSNVNPTSELSF